MRLNDQNLIRAAINVAFKSRENGNHPFGALLVDRNGNILMEAENTVITGKDCTGHAETNLMRKASKKYDAEFLAGCSLYTSTEPCPMCSGAIFWGDVGRVVYAVSQKRLHSLMGEKTREVLLITCREVFDKGKKSIEVVGPILEDEAIRAHEGFWI
ncbi:MAG: nucleoside deaminase [Anaerolineales bacterium]